MRKVDVNDLSALECTLHLHRDEKSNVSVLVVAFAGVTHPAPLWQHALRPDGRMLLPLTGESWWGAMVLFARSGDTLRGTTLGRCGFFHCAGARDPQTAKDLTELWSDHALLKNAQIELRMEGSGARYAVIDPDETQPG